MSYFDPLTWRAFTRGEMRDLLAAQRKAPTDDVFGYAASDKPSRKGLVLRTEISPLDAYTYLRARFGDPNGLQTFLAKDDSDNLFHWDFFLKAGARNLIFTGATQEVHVVVEDELSDPDWLRFIGNFKGDFGRVGKEKSQVLSGLEKWSIFPNQYLSIANRCADLHHQLSISLAALQTLIFDDSLRPNEPAFVKNAARKGRLLTRVTTASTELTILMPVMFESFIGLLVAGLTKPEVRSNRRMFDAFVRSHLDVKLMDLANRCNGFDRPIAHDNEVLRRYWKVVNKRNDVIHGNVDPVRDSLDIVYFDGRRPLLRSGGDRIAHFWRGLIEQYKPEEVVADYLLTHEFICEILNHMSPPVRDGIIAIMSDTQPGWDDKRKIFGRLFPDHLVMTVFQGQRYDSDLESGLQET